MINTGGCDTCIMQEVMIHIQEVVIQCYTCRRL